MHPPDVLYFGYGSNLHREDLERWCAERGHRGAELRVVGPAWLPDAEPVFHYYSRARKGGALNVRARHGCAVPGVIFDVNEAGWRALDEKEGAPRYYRRVQRVALTSTGEEREVGTYQVAETHRRAEHVPPTAHYERTVREGLRLHHLPDEHIGAAARGLDVPALPRAVFVYGTLMRGECREPLVARHRPDRWAPARAPGRLVDLGDYPGLVASNGEATRVRGELLSLDEPGELLRELDEVEDFRGYGAEDNLYRRVITAVESAGGRTFAWTYRYVGPTAGAAPIASGDWRRR